ncbi:MAG: putative Acyl-CoA dehydrogenase [Marmoricola sp.]|jgi:acyl-CoA dehydrogenase|nr:putative Acyl-CoA dehydrogenase [Marmoricola sp.]
MSDNELEPILAGMLSDHCGPDQRRRDENGEWCGELWALLDSAGVTSLSNPEELGGQGGELEDACLVLRLAGRSAVPLPLAEHGFLAGWMLSRSGVPIPDGVLTVGVDPAPDLRLRSTAGGWRVKGTVRRVPWARHADWLVAFAATADGPRVVAIPLSEEMITHGTNLAGEARDAVEFDDVPVNDALVARPGEGVDAESFRLRGALTRGLLMSGALEHVVKLTVEYAWVRHQFGRPIANFQAVQQHLVRLNAESTAAGLAVQSAVARHASGDPARFELAAAKQLTSHAATLATALAHQVHGAIGMTEEYELQQYTRRLMSWRQEFGSSRFWAARIGEQVVAGGADLLWPRISDTMNGRDGLESLRAGQQPASVG